MWPAIRWLIHRFLQEDEFVHRTALIRLGGGIERNTEDHHSMRDDYHIELIIRSMEEQFLGSQTQLNHSSYTFTTRELALLPFNIAITPEVEFDYDK